MGKLFRRFKYWIESRHREAELADEMEFHWAMKQAEGASPGTMGNMTLAREDARAVWIWPWLESMWQDLTYGLRGMRRAPGFTAVALLALGSAIGVNTSLFSAFNALALRPLPVSDPSHVVNLFRLLGKGTGGFSLAEFHYLAGHSRSLSGVVATRFGDQASNDGHKINDCYVSGNYFRVLGVPMQLGRGFLDEEDVAGKPEAVVVLSYDVWQSWFGGDPTLVGKQIRLSDVPFTIVGITPQSFQGTLGSPTDAWIPFPAKQLLRPNDASVIPFLTSPTFCCSDMTARLAPGVSREQAQAEIQLLLDQFNREATGPSTAEHLRIAVTSTAWLDNPGRKKEKVVPVFVLMFLAVTLVVLLACANVGNLLLARAAARRHEMGVRLSLGGSRMRLVRQLLIESLALATSAALLGLAISLVLPSVIVTRIAGATMFHLSPDLTVLAYTMLLAVLASVTFGLAPALHATRGNIIGALKQNSVLPGVRLSLRDLLLSVQVAISVMLLAAAGMLIRGVQKARSADPGFAIDDVTAIAFEMPANSYGGGRSKAFARDLMDRLQAVPDLPPWGLSMDTPLGNSKTSTGFHLPGETQDRPVLIHEVSSGYFDVLRIPILNGRNFAPGDVDRHSIVINETMAKRYWPEGNPTGKSVTVNATAREIIGIAKDAYTSALGSIEPTVYFPMDGIWMPQVLLRDRGNLGRQKIEAMVKGLESRAVIRSTPLRANLQLQTQASLAGAAIAGGLGVLALALAAIGMSGVFAYAVRQRTREIGIRMALGAEPRSVMRLVLGTSLRAVAAGLLVGFALTAAVARPLQHQFYGVTLFDVGSYVGVVLLLGLTALLAGVGPARRAASLDPINALREE